MIPKAAVPMPSLVANRPCSARRRSYSAARPPACRYPLTSTWNDSDTRGRGVANHAGRVTGRWRIVETDQASGRGSAVLAEDDTRTGHLFIHLGEDSGFRATPSPRTEARGGR